MVLHFITTRQKPTLKVVQSMLTFQQETRISSKLPAVLPPLPSAHGTFSRAHAHCTGTRASPLMLPHMRFTAGEAADEFALKACIAFAEEGRGKEKGSPC